VDLKLSTLVESLAPSGIRAFFDLVISMDDVISLGVGEPDFKTPWHISRYAIQKIEEGFTTYVSNSGLLELREEIALYLKNTYQLSYVPENEVLITVGVSEALDLALRALTNPGDEFLIHEPCYVSYKPTILLAGGACKVIPTVSENGFKLTPEMIESACGPKTKGLIFNYPCNPTGTTYTQEELEKLAKMIEKKNLFLLSDEIYHQLSYDHPHVSIASFPCLQGRVLYLNGFSKGYAMTGWRIGYAAGPCSVIAAMTKIHQYTMLCAPIMGQFAAIEALRHGEEPVASMCEEYKKRRNFIVKRLNAIGFQCHSPGGAFYAFPEIPKKFVSSFQFANELLKEERVAVVPGTAFFDGDRHIRISYASSMEKLQEASNRMERFIKNHS
jgi:aminotransferase